MPNPPLHNTSFQAPAIVLFGIVDDVMYANFCAQMIVTGDRDFVVVELSTLGGAIRKLLT